jgi:hypothetical protein
MRIAFDIGGVISKYPEIFKSLIRALNCASNEDVEDIDMFIITDMHKMDEIRKTLELNGLSQYFPAENVYSADFEQYGEACKAVLLKSLDIDLFFDDFPAYVSEGDETCRCLVMPNITKPYYSDAWKTPTDVGLFGRRKRVDNFLERKRSL